MIKLIYYSLYAQLRPWHKGIFFPKWSVHKTVEASFCIPFSLPHPPVTPVAKKKAKFSMLCNSTVKQAMELIAKKNTGKQTKGIQEQQVIL